MRLAPNLARLCPQSPIPTPKRRKVLPFPVMGLRFSAEKNPKNLRDKPKTTMLFQKTESKIWFSLMLFQNSHPRFRFFSDLFPKISRRKRKSTSQNQKTPLGFQHTLSRKEDSLDAFQQTRRQIHPPKSLLMPSALFFRRWLRRLNRKLIRLRSNQRERHHGARPHSATARLPARLMHLFPLRQRRLQLPRQPFPPTPQRS